jgi:hypothetical protein
MARVSAAGGAYKVGGARCGFVACPCCVGAEVLVLRAWVGCRAPLAGSYNGVSALAQMSKEESSIEQLLVQFDKNGDGVCVCVRAAA